MATWRRSRKELERRPGSRPAFRMSSGVGLPKPCSGGRLLHGGGGALGFDCLGVVQQELDGDGVERSVGDRRLYPVSFCQFHPQVELRAVPADPLTHAPLPGLEPIKGTHRAGAERGSGGCVVSSACRGYQALLGRQGQRGQPLVVDGLSMCRRSSVRPTTRRGSSPSTEDPLTATCALDIDPFGCLGGCAVSGLATLSRFTT